MVLVRRNRCGPLILTGTKCVHGQYICSASLFLFIFVTLGPLGMTGFRVKSQQVTVLEEPSQFYSTLLEKCRNAERRIVIASLYIGTGPLEMKFLSAISARLSEKPNLSVSILLDCLRGSRGEENSRTMLLPLIKDHDIKVSLYHTPRYRGFLRRIIPHRINEALGVQHMKLYLFDDDLIITGANLSNDYFTQRQDRYMVISGCESLGNFVSNLVSKVSDFSFQLDGDNKLNLKPFWEIHPINDNFSLFINSVKDHIKHFLSQYSDVETNLDNENDTVLYPLLEMGQFGINQESTIERKIVELCNKHADVKMATGYFNLTEELANSIVTKCQAAVNILTSHPKANGFYNAKGIAGGIPRGYRELAGRFLDKIFCHRQQNRIAISEYQRDGWTYHAKGLWISPSMMTPPFLTSIGSSNFGERSYSLDIECQFVIVTSNPELQTALQNEWQQLFKYSSPYTTVERQQKPPLWVRVLIFFFKNYL